MIVCVDDNPLQLKWLATRLRLTLSLPVSSVETVASALALIDVERDTIDLVVTDLDFGYDDPRGGERLLMHVVREQPEIPVIVLTKHDDTESAVVLMERGAYSFVPNGTPGDGTFRVLIEKARRALEKRNLQREVTKQQRQIEEQHARLDQDLRRARDLQREWVPASVRRHGWSLAAICEPSDQVSGDFVWVDEIPGASVVLALGDATGHGVAAALLAVRVRQSLEHLTRESPDPEHVLARLRTGLKFLEPPWTMPLFYGTASSDGTLQYFNAGGPRPLLLSPAGCVLLPASVPILAHGVFAGTTDSIETLAVSDGSVVVVYSDGLSDAVGGEEALVDSVDDAWKRETASSSESVLRWLTGLAPAVRRDDLSIIVLRKDCTAPGVRSS